MKDQDENKRQREQAFAKKASTKDGLVARYGAHLEDEHLSEGDKEALLVTLWQIMQGFVDLGFSVKAGDKFYANADLGMNDVLEYLILEDTAHETVAPPLNKQTKEQP